MVGFWAIIWRDKFGRDYMYSIYSIDTEFKAAPDNYNVDGKTGAHRVTAHKYVANSGRRSVHPALPPF